MSQSSNSSWSLLAVIGLLGLTFLATVLYSGSPDQQVKLNNNFFWRETRIVFNSSLGFLGVVTDVSLRGTNNSSSANSNSKVNNSQQAENKTLHKISPVETDNNSGFFSRLKSNLQKAWDQSDGNDADSVSDFNKTIQNTINSQKLESNQSASGFQRAVSSNNASSSQLERFIEWRPIVGGTEIIFKLKNGQEYKFVLPIKILGQKNSS